jgi:hypothetical protein
VSDLIFGQSIETASVGNGGAASAAANGGAVAVGDINSGGNVGGAIGVGNTHGDVLVSGPNAANSTSLGVGANAGSAVADASGGDFNVAFVS